MVNFLRILESDPNISTNIGFWIVFEILVRGTYYIYFRAVYLCKLVFSYLLTFSVPLTK